MNKLKWGGGWDLSLKRANSFSTCCNLKLKTYFFFYILVLFFFIFLKELKVISRSIISKTPWSGLDTVYKLRATRNQSHVLFWSILFCSVVNAWLGNTHVHIQYMQNEAEPNPNPVWLCHFTHVNLKLWPVGRHSWNSPAAHLHWQLP